MKNQSLHSLKRLKEIRFLLFVIVLGLVASGATAFPLRWEVDLLAKFLIGDPKPESVETLSALESWILRVQAGLHETYERHPFMAYGTDWLAFGHLVIALFFVPVWLDPVRYRANLIVGLWACLLVFPLAFLCGSVRGIPWGWQLIDCSFGLVAGVVFLVLLRLVPRNLDPVRFPQLGSSPTAGYPPIAWADPCGGESTAPDPEPAR